MRAPDFGAEQYRTSDLSPISRFWSWKTSLRIGKVVPFQVDVPVICIGNVVAGGAGKTPVALSVMEAQIYG